MSLASISSNRGDYIGSEERERGLRGCYDDEGMRVADGNDHEELPRREQEECIQASKILSSIFSPPLSFAAHLLRLKVPSVLAVSQNLPYSLCVYIYIYTHIHTQQQPTSYFTNLIYHPPFFLYCFWNSLCYLLPLHSTPLLLLLPLLLQLLQLFRVCFLFLIFSPLPSTLSYQSSSS